MKVIFDPKEVTLTTDEVLKTSQMIVTLNNNIKAGNYQIVVLATSTNGTVQQIETTVKVKALGLITTSILLTMSPKELELDTSLTVFGQLANISETEASIPTNTELKLIFTSPVGKLTEFVVNTTEDGSYQLAETFRPDEVGEW